MSIEGERDLDRLDRELERLRDEQARVGKEQADQAKLIAVLAERVEAMVTAFRATRAALYSLAVAILAGAGMIVFTGTGIHGG